MSSGWVKNIHEYIEEGRKYVAKIYRVNQEKMMFDVSLKRVSDKEKKDKLDQERHEKKATKLIEIVSKKCGLNPADMSSKLLSNYDSLSEFIDELEENEIAYFGQKYPEKFLESLKSLLKTSTEKKEVIESKIIELIGKGSDGVERVKSALGSIVVENLEIKYLSSPRYMLRIKAQTHKEASKTLSTAVSKLNEDKNLTVKVSDDEED